MSNPAILFRNDTELKWVFSPMSTTPYNYVKNDRYINITEGARILSVSRARFERAVRSLRIRVVRTAYLLLIPKGELKNIAKKLKKEGRKRIE